MNIIPTPISDKEAAKLLGVSYGAIRQSVARGDLTRVPMAGRIQHVAKEQVMLFRGKKMLRSSLNGNERKAWEEINAAILGKTKAPVTSSQTTMEPLIEYFINELARKIVDEQERRQQAKEAQPNFPPRQALKEKELSLTH